MSNPSIKVIYDPAVLIMKYRKRKKAAQVFLDEQVMKDTNQYVRFRTGALARSVRTATRAGSGTIVYDTPYARRAYYDEMGHVSKDVHVNATTYWFEASKAKRLQSWLDGVSRILKEGNI